jgi:hypothetical protein
MGEIMRWRLARAAQRRIPADVNVLSIDGTGDYQINAETYAVLQDLQNNPGGSNYATYVQILWNVLSVETYLVTLIPPSGAAAPAPRGRALVPAAGAAPAKALARAVGAAPAKPLAPAAGAAPANTSQAFSALLQFDRWLASCGNKPSVGELSSEVSSLVATYLGTPTWTSVHMILNELFYAALILSAIGMNFSMTEVLGLLCRLILVVGLVDLLEQTPSPLQTPDDIYRALRWRTPVLPYLVVAILTALRVSQQAVLVRKPGFADLYITREEWDHYEPAEIASIENILAHETKKHVHVLVNKTQTTTTTDISTTTLKEQDTTTTDLTQLQQQSTSDISIAAHVDAQVDTSGQYGPTQVNTHLGGSLDFSSATATSKATTQSHETVARAVNKVEKSTREIRTVSTLTQSVDKEVHNFDNQTDQKVVGIYRWVDQIQNVELDRYPHRFLLEFELPEPGAWTRWLHQNDVSAAMINQLPPPLTLTGNAGDLPLTPDALVDPDYQKYIARYNVQGVSAPPDFQKVVAINLSYPKPDTDPNPDKVMDRFVSDTTLAVPDGYWAKTWVAEGASRFSEAGIGEYSGPSESVFDIVVGGGAPVEIQTAGGLL